MLRAIRILGGQAALARACGGGCKQQHVWNWLNRDRKVPAEFVLAIEKATGGQVLRHQLRPDIYPPVESQGLKPFSAPGSARPEG